ncbi:MAG: endonuclease VIII [Pseudomonadales bacterium]|nr:endonuclease VIII [Pseudomonadales bacterium]NIX07476.1 endonuclease VIII [Pseudomonadales bacterium]
MPEGPEIRREADRIEAAIRGRRIEEVYFGLQRLTEWADALTGATVEAVDTRGKALLTGFDNGYTLYSHNQLYGKWMVRRRGVLPKTNRQLRVALHTAESSALLYSASTIEVLPTECLPEFPPIARLGPDVLDATLGWKEVALRLRDPKFSGRAVAALYLDQHFMAGVGNYLRSEVLFAAGVHPSARPKDLSTGHIGRLARATLSISRRSYETGGVTVPKALAGRLKKEGLPRSAHRFSVFARQGLPCHQCGETITRINASSRRLYFCPRCQPE